MGDYRNFTLKLPNKGLDLVSPADTLNEGRYPRLSNVRGTVEGALIARRGTAVQYNLPAGGTVNYIRRLRDDSLLFGRTDATLFRNTTQLTLPAGASLSGNPITAVRFKNAMTGESWSYLADSTAMLKVRSSDGTVYLWGIEGPSTGLAFSATSSGVLDSSVTAGLDYDWRYTYYSSATGAESNPSPVETSIPVVSQKGFVTGFVVSADPQVDIIRVYRRGGTIGTWNLVTEIPNTTAGSASYLDNTADSAIALNEQLNENRDVPFTTVDASGGILLGTPMRFIWGPFNGRYIFACGDPNRPGYVYWTDPDDADSADSSNNLSVSSPAEPLVNGFIYGANSYLWTRDNLYTLDYGGPDATPTFVPRQIPLGMGLSFRYGFCQAAGLLWFVSKDGIYSTDCQSTLDSITLDSIRPLFMGRAAEDRLPIDFTAQDETRLINAGQELHFFYKDTGGSNQHLVYDILHKRWQYFDCATPTFTMAYGDENQTQFTLLLAGDDGDVYGEADTGTDSGTAVVASARTGAWDASIPLTLKEWGNALLDADPAGGNITFTPLYNAEETAGTASVVTASNRQSFPISLEDTFAKNISFDISWGGTGEIYQIVLLFREDEEPIYHWEQPEMSHNPSGAPSSSPGWSHVRDGYFCVRSDQDITLTHTVDGVAYTYTLASTSGQKRRVYIKFAPVRGKLYRYSLDSAGLFRLYGEETQLNVKPWNTALSYTPMYPFIGVGYAPYLRKEAGT